MKKFKLFLETNGISFEIPTGGIGVWISTSSLSLNYCPEKVKKIFTYAFKNKIDVTIHPNYITFKKQ